MTIPAPLQTTPMDPSPHDTTSTPSASTSAPAKPKTFRLPDNALTATIGTLLGVFVVLAFSQTNARISDTNNQISRLESKVDAGFAAQDAKVEARFAAQDAKLDDINLKLTALIAALNATTEVEAALEGRLLDPNAPPPG